MEKVANQKRRFDYIFLKNFCIENKLTLVNDYSNVFITRESVIDIYCVGENCKNICSKRFRYLVNNKNFGCNNCCQKLMTLKTKKTCLEKYGVECSVQNKEIKDKIKKTMIEKYGCEHALQSSIFKEKFKNTCIEKFGVENPTLNQEVKSKVKNTFIEKYGVENPFQSEEIKDKIKVYNMNKYGFECNSKSQELKDKYKQTCLKKYGTDSHTQSEKVKEKIKETCLKKYGVENPQQDPEISEKSSKKAYTKKIYTFPSGRQDAIQGYENLAINELLEKEKIEENNIITSRKIVPKIWYNDIKGKKRRHFVDIFIPSQNKCIEVKSTWTAEKKKDSIYLKQQAAKDLGYEYEIWIYNRKFEKVNTIC